MCKKSIIAVIMVMIIATSNFVFADETVYGNKIDEDILFNNLKWGSSREDVLSFFKEKYSNMEIEEERSEYDYGKMKQLICSYKNRNSLDNLGKVGDMEIDEINVWYIYEESKYNYSMFAAQYKCENYSTFESMVEMLEYKYGSPYSYYEDNYSTTGFDFDVDRFIWKNQNETQELWITRNNNILDMGAILGLGSNKTYEKNIEIYYSNIELRNYLYDYRELYEAQQKEAELENKDYDGL